MKAMKSSVKKLRSRSSSKNKVASSGEPLASVGGKDPSLDLFHAIGKVLYCKREEEVLALNKLRGPKHRAPLQNNPEAVLAKAPMSEDSFACFLHQSYADFFSKMDDLADAAEYFSAADPLFNEWTVRNGILALIF